jgi:hypothetical protein
VSGPTGPMTVVMAAAIAANRDPAPGRRREGRVAMNVSGPRAANSTACSHYHGSF